MVALPRRTRLLVLLLTLALGALLFVWRLGATGLVDETPPLFAASARGMVERGDWLIPHVNGLPRYDKPPLVYWLMGLLYALPGQSRWDPLGTWAAALPSALASLTVMLALADTLLRWPQAAAGPAHTARSGLNTPLRQPALTALTAALAFGLSPLVLLWGRIPVSDAVFTGLVALSALASWRRYADAGQSWSRPWLLLGLAVLAKGPVAVVLLLLTLLLFLGLQGDGERLRQQLRPLAGLGLTGLVALPWYLLALLRDGRAFWDSFFGYHNLQRFSAVVNDHLQPWWYFGPVLVVASLPLTPLLLLGLQRAIGPLRWQRSPRRWLLWPVPQQALPAAASLARFATCWLLAVLLFFTAAATKLPSYWLPATPAAALLVALAGQGRARSGDGAAAPDPRSDRTDQLAWALSLALTALLALAFALAPLWLPLIREPEMPTLPAELLASGHLRWAALLWGAAALGGWLWRGSGGPRRLLTLQLPLVAFVPAALLPSWTLGDQLRGLPVRQIAAAVQRLARPGEPLAMVGILKPSLHFYSRRVVIYEGIEPEGLLNLADRLRREDRPGMAPAPASRRPTALVVIDRGTAAAPFWRGLEPQELAQAGLYRLWRLDRQRLEQRAAALQAAGHRPTWTLPRPERY
ncbi:MAG: ArnT family glycosyltransferase [Cyanobium sp.]